MPSPAVDRRPRRVVLIVVALLSVGAVAAFAVPPVREAVQNWIAPAINGHGKEKENGQANGKRPAAVELVEDEHHHDGVKVSAEAIRFMELHPVAAVPALKPRPLPPQPGKLNYDRAGMPIVYPRFQGQVEDLKVVHEGQPPYNPDNQRPLRAYDRVKQGDVLAVIWSRDLGVAKADLIDAIQNLRLSKDQLERYEKLYQDGAMPLAKYKEQERQVQIDTSAFLKAERTLRIYKLSDKDIDDIKQEANSYLDRKVQRNVTEEIKRWARVEVKVPEDAKNPEHEYVVLEMNISKGDIVDPGRDTPMFRLGDLSRMQIWVHPPEEYVPMLRERLAQGSSGAMRWQIKFQAEPDQPALDLPVAYMAPAVDPNNYTPMLVGYLENKERKYLVGQFVTATIFVPAPEDTVEVPTEAINQYENQQFVVVQHPEKKDQFFLRRVALAGSSGHTTLVRSKLRPEDEELSKHEVARGKRPLEALRPGERVITKGVVELTSKIDELVTEREAERQQQAAEGKKE